MAHTKKAKNGPLAQTNVISRGYCLLGLPDICWENHLPLSFSARKFPSRCLPLSQG